MLGCIRPYGWDGELVTCMPAGGNQKCGLMAGGMHDRVQQGDLESMQMTWQKIVEVALSQYDCTVSAIPYPSQKREGGGSCCKVLLKMFFDWKQVCSLVLGVLPSVAQPTPFDIYKHLRYYVCSCRCCALCCPCYSSF